jgi:hypothetical protein
MIGRTPRTTTGLAAVISEMVLKGATTDQIVAAFREKYPEIIRAENDQLIQMALVKLVNDICRRRTGATPASVQPDLFGEFHLPGSVTVTVRDKDGTRREKKAVASLTKEEAETCVKEHTRAKRRRSAQFDELARLVDHLAEVGTARWTLERCWRKKHG